MTKLFVEYLHRQVKNDVKMSQENTKYRLRAILKKLFT